MKLLIIHGLEGSLLTKPSTGLIKQKSLVGAFSRQCNVKFREVPLAALLMWHHGAGDQVTSVATLATVPGATSQCPQSATSAASIIVRLKYFNSANAASLPPAIQHQHRPSRCCTQPRSQSQCCLLMSWVTSNMYEYAMWMYRCVDCILRNTGSSIAPC